jgi:hypothetical protein
MKCDPSDAEDFRDEILAVPEPRPPAYRAALVGMMRIVDCVPVERVPPGKASWANGPWCFIIDEVRAFDRPISWKGALGFFEVPDEIVAAVSNTLAT